MSMESLYKLSILVNMIDRVSGPAAKISSGVAGTVNQFQAYSRGMAEMARDGVVLMGTGYQVANAAVAPVKATFDTQDALAELSSLGVEKLGELEDAASQFSNTWAGTNKAQFLTAAYDIKSGIASLSDEGVAQYTELAGVTAKATKSTIGEMTSLFATGYGIYKDYYKDLSDLEFGEIFSGGIAQSVKQFKTTGSGMAQAISALGGSATSANVPLEEQLSILGMLQATMSGSEAGTKYTAFLQNAARAGKELGLKFTDANGQLKSMPEILGSIQGKFGDVLTASDKLELQKAFGTIEAVKLIDLLYSKTDDLQGNIITLYDTMGKGMSITEEMANKINAPPGQSWELLRQKMQTTLETVGNAMLPTFIKLQEGLERVADKIIDLTNKHPELISNIMFAVGAFGAFLTTIGALKLGLGGIGTLITGGARLWKLLTAAVGGAKYAMFLAQYGLYNLKGALAPLGSALVAAAGNIKTMMVGMLAWVKQGIMSAIAALPGLISSVWSFTTALLANPITWIVIGIVALIAALILLWQNWDKVTAFLQNTWNKVCGAIASAINWVKDKLDSVPEPVKKVLAVLFPFITIPKLIIENWDKIKAFFMNLPENIKQGWHSLVSWFQNFFSNLGTTFKEAGKKLIETFVSGIISVISKPVEAVKSGLSKIREMLPFSDAHTGPLSQLTLSGRRVFETFDEGMQQSKDLPAQTAESAFSVIDDGPDSGSGADNATGRQAVRSTTIQQLIINCKLDDIEDLRKLKQLIQDIEDGINGDDLAPEPEPVF